MTRKSRLRVAIVGLIALILALLLFAERGRPLLPSSWRYVRTAGWRRLFSHHSLHGYLYGRWTNQYIAFLKRYVYPCLGIRGRRWLSDRYHAKVLTTPQARAIVALDREIPLRDLEQVIPYAQARDLVLSASPAIAAYECACRRASANPCHPTQVCLAIGDFFADFILEHHPHSSRRLTQAEALALLEAEHSRGHLHTAWFKDACLGRFYAICNCCRCCCTGIEAVVKHGIPMLAPSGYVAQVDESRCRGCRACLVACPFGAISNESIARVSWEKCMGCGVCSSQCPYEAITLGKDESKGLPLHVRLLT
mgnify:CR=1 FL=1